MPEDQNSKNAADSNITLSAALLSPINSLFEAQAHSARAFLNFILQLGFKDQVSEASLLEEEGRLRKEGTLSTDDIKKFTDLRALLKQKAEYNTLKNTSDLTDEQRQRKKELSVLLAEQDMLEDVYTVQFNYLDGNGNEHTIVIPVLALIPVQPLAIKSATFDFRMSIQSTSENYKQQQESRSGSEKRPWFFIQPKRIKGTIDDKGSSTESKGIDIHVEVESAPIPQGLSNLLTSLTQSGRVTNDD